MSRSKRRPIRQINAERKLRFGQFTLLGFTITENPRTGACYSFEVPDGMARPHGKGWVSGYYSRRWECVESALRQFGVLQ